jgi:hypothetical protein
MPFELELIGINLYNCKKNLCLNQTYTIVRKTYATRDLPLKNRERERERGGKQKERPFCHTQ